MGYFFLGERPSPKAKAMGVSWKDGRLAAKQLFDALREAGVNPKDCRFDNVYLPTLEKEPHVKPWLGRTLRRAVKRGDVLIAMGKKVAAVLDRLKFNYVPIIHPAARGRIRHKRKYAAHIRQQLTQEISK